MCLYMPCIHPTECSIDIYTVNVKRLNFFSCEVDVFKYQHMTQYNTSTQQVKIYDEISTLSPVALNLWEVDRCFGDETYQWLKGLPNNGNNAFFCSGLGQRLQLKHGSEDFVRINQIGMDMSNTMSDIVAQPLQLMDTKYWIDLPQFGCQTHEDAPEIYVSYQVYVYSGLSDAGDWFHEKIGPAQGAKFLHVTPPVQIQFRPNHGYINLNSDLKPHRVDGTWDTRISVMFQYSRV